jgi:hypothetical protein
MSERARHPARAALLAALALLAPLATGCPPSSPDMEPPLRPLVYTESPDPEEAPLIPGYEAWADGSDPSRYPGMPELVPAAMAYQPPSDEDAGDDALSDPATLSVERLGRAVFLAMVDPTADLEPLFLSVEDYAAVAHTSEDRARTHLAEAMEDARDVTSRFRGEVPSERRPGGLGALVEVDGVRVPEGRLASGEVAENPDDSVMVWGVEIMLRLRGTEQVFRLRLPKVLRSPAGHWGLAEAPELGGRLAMYLDMGFHLSPSLLAFEHYPLPFQTGNFWTYQLRTLPRADAEGDAVEHLADETLPRMRDEVIERQDYDGYALVRIRRSYTEEGRRDETFAYLLTARRVYSCNRDCQRNIEQIDWLVSHLSSAVTPRYVFPLRPGMGWRRGGRIDAEGDYQVWSTPEVAAVPAGRFEDALRVTHSARAGREHLYFANGIGAVLVRIDGASETTFRELVDYRIIP